MNNWKTAEINLYRAGQHMGSFRVQHYPEIKSGEQLEKAIEDAVNEWIGQYPDGKAAYSYTSGELNYGDLLAGMCPPDSIQIRHGFLILKEDVDSVFEMNFDHALCDENIEEE